MLRLRRPEVLRNALHFVAATAPKKHIRLFAPGFKSQQKPAMQEDTLPKATGTMNQNRLSNDFSSNSPQQSIEVEVTNRTASDLLQSFKQKLSFIKNVQLIATHDSNLKTTTQNKPKYSRQFFEYIEDVTHMDEVRKSQQKVMDIKNELRNTGTQKRAILKELDVMRSDLNKIYHDMKFINNRTSGHYIDLVKMEIDLCKKEKTLQEAFLAADEQEQYLFNSFSAAINESYEKEKLHANFIKVLGIIGTLLGTFLTLIVSVIGQINHSNKFYALRDDFENTLLTQHSKTMDELKKRMMYLEKKITTKAPESWGSYLNRHTRWTYSWAIPKK